ncbi:hypothetical protein [Microbacterium aurum]
MSDASDSLFDLSQPDVDDRATPPPAAVPMMSADQRTKIRALFGELGITTAREQFGVVKELTGTTITSVADLTAATAHRLVERLAARVRDVGKTRTGNSWDDREEDTWIDRL